MLAEGTPVAHQGSPSAPFLRKGLWPANLPPASPLIGQTSGVPAHSRASPVPSMVQNNMVGIAQLAEHRIVVPGVVGSSPITHPILWLRAGASAPALASILAPLGCSQVVRHGTLTPAFVGSSPTIPARPTSPWLARGDTWKISYDLVAQLVEQRPFKAKVRGSSPRWVTIENALFSLFLEEITHFFVIFENCT